MANFDPFLSLDCARVEEVGAHSKERKGSNFCHLATLREKRGTREARSMAAAATGYSHGRRGGTQGRGAGRMTATLARKTRTDGRRVDATGIQFMPVITEPK